MAVRAGSARTSLFHSRRSRLFAKNVTLGKYLERMRGTAAAILAMIWQYSIDGIHRALAAPLTRQGQMKPRGCRRTRSANCRATSTTTAPQYRWRLWLTFFKGLQASSRTEIVFVWNANEGSATVWSSTSSVASCCPTTRSRMYQQQKSRNLFSERLTIHGWRRSPSSPLMRPFRGGQCGFDQSGRGSISRKTIIRPFCWPRPRRLSASTQPGLSNCATPLNCTVYILMPRNFAPSPEPPRSAPWSSF